MDYYLNKASRHCKFSKTSSFTIYTRLCSEIKTSVKKEVTKTEQCSKNVYSDNCTHRQAKK